MEIFAYRKKILFLQPKEMFPAKCPYTFFAVVFYIKSSNRKIILIKLKYYED